MLNLHLNDSAHRAVVAVVGDRNVHTASKAVIKVGSNEYRRLRDEYKASACGDSIEFANRMKRISALSSECEFATFPWLFYFTYL